MARKLNNLNFIATYIFEHPGCSASEVRRSLYIFKNAELDENFSEKKSYISYFQMSKESSLNRGYAGKYWKKVEEKANLLGIPMPSAKVDPFSEEAYKTIFSDMEIAKYFIDIGVEKINIEPGFSDKVKEFLLTY